MTTARLSEADMAGIKFLKGSEEWQLFMDYWELCQKYWEPEEREEYWDGLLSAADRFYRKYGSQFAKDLAGKLVEELGRKHNRKGS